MNRQQLRRLPGELWRRARQFDVRALWPLFRATVKSGDVDLFAWVYYAFIATFGLYATFYAAPNTVIDPYMGHVAYDIWAWACFICPASVMFGLAMPGFGKRKLAGIVLQLGGNVGIGFILAAFEYCALVATPWGKGSVVVFIVPPYIIGCVFLALRNCFDLYDAEIEAK